MKKINFLLPMLCTVAVLSACSKSKNSGSPNPSTNLKQDTDATIELIKSEDYPSREKVKLVGHLFAQAEELEQKIFAAMKILDCENPSRDAAQAKCSLSMILGVDTAHKEEKKNEGDTAEAGYVIENLKISGAQSVLQDAIPLSYYTWKSLATLGDISKFEPKANPKYIRGQKQNAEARLKNLLLNPILKIQADAHLKYEEPLEKIEEGLRKRFNFEFNTFTDFFSDKGLTSQEKERVRNDFIKQLRVKEQGCFVEYIAGEFCSILVNRNFSYERNSLMESVLSIPIQVKEIEKRLEEERERLGGYSNSEERQVTKLPVHIQTFVNELLDYNTAGNRYRDGHASETLLRKAYDFWNNHVNTFDDLANLPKKTELFDTYSKVSKVAFNLAQIVPFCEYEAPLVVETLSEIYKVAPKNMPCYLTIKDENSGEELRVLSRDDFK